MTKKMDDDRIINHVETIWNGGERILAGKRASEYIFGSSKKPNEKLQDAIIERVPGIREYIVAPYSAPVENVPDHGGNPLSDQPEARAPSTGEANLSDNKGKEEQNEIDKALEAGRKAREKADMPKDVDQGGSTMLNPPEGNGVKPSGKP